MAEKRSEARSKKITVRTDGERLARLHELADQAGVPVADYLIAKGLDEPFQPPRKRGPAPASQDGSLFDMAG